MSGIISDNVLKQSGLIKASAGGAWTFLSKATASSSATLTFASGIDSTYGTYVFTFNNIHPATDAADFTAGFRDGSTAYDATKTTTTTYNYHNEADGTTGLTYDGGHDMAQGTGFCQIGGDALGYDNDQCCSGYMYLFNPSNTTYVTHFMAVMNTITEADYTVNEYTQGMCNVTAAIDGVQFKMSSGNIDAGDICLYGITT